MKTKIILSVAGLIALTFQAFTTTHIISANGFSYSPSSISIHQGDTVLFNIGSSHNALEISKDTWDANGTASNGGFNLGFGGGQLIFNTPGTFYFICTPHASFGMKGAITVSGSSATANVLSETDIPGLETLYPNPLSDNLTIGFSVTEPSNITIDLLDITGMRVKQLTNKRYTAGRHVENFDLAYLKPGKYFVLYNSRYKRNVLSFIKTN